MLEPFRIVVKKRNMSSETTAATISEESGIKKKTSTKKLIVSVEVGCESRFDAERRAAELAALEIVGNNYQLSTLFNASLERMHQYQYGSIFKVWNPENLNEFYIFDVE